MNLLETMPGIPLWEHMPHQYLFHMVIYYLVNWIWVLKLVNFTENILNVEDPGRALWMTREEYITFGTQTLAITDDLLDEDGWIIICWITRFFIRLAGWHKTSGHFTPGTSVSWQETPEDFWHLDMWHLWTFDTQTIVSLTSYTHRHLTPTDMWHPNIWHPWTFDTRTFDTYGHLTPVHLTRMDIWHPNICHLDISHT